MPIFELHCSVIHMNSDYNERVLQALFNPAALLHIVTTVPHTQTRCTWCTGFAHWVNRALAGRMLVSPKQATAQCLLTQSLVHQQSAKVSTFASFPRNPTGLGSMHKEAELRPRQLCNVKYRHKAGSRQCIYAFLAECPTY